MLAGFRHLPGYLSPGEQQRLRDDIAGILRSAPLYVPTMPRSGRPMSVRMTNCGPLGWVTDKTGGYRYQQLHPVTGRPWPAMPERLLDIWRGVSDCVAVPEACLVNYYGATAKLGLHQDMDEDDRAAPVVSVSLGDEAWFRVGGLRRTDTTERVLLKSGDVVVLGGEARMAFHGVDRILPGSSDLLAVIAPLLGGAEGRINLTLRRVSRIRDGR